MNEPKDARAEISKSIEGTFAAKPELILEMCRDMLSDLSYAKAEKWLMRLNNETPPHGQIERFDGSTYFIDTISVNSRKVNVVLSEMSFNKNREDQIAAARMIGCRLATREESMTYALELLEKEKTASLSPREGDALGKFKAFIRDEKGAIHVKDDRIWTDSRALNWSDEAAPFIGAMFVRILDDSK